MNEETQKMLSLVLSKLDDITARLAKLEDKSNPFFVDLTHASLRKFELSEATETNLYNEKACRFEPDKPCDSCAMCNSLGF